MRKKKLGASAFSPDQMLFTVKEAAHYCGFSTKAGFLRRVKRGDVTAEPPDRRNAETMFRREELDRFVNAKVNISTEFEEEKRRFTTDEAARYCGYKTKTGITHHIYDTKLLKPDEVITNGGKSLLLIFYRNTLDKFIERRKTEIKPGPYGDKKTN